MAGARRRGMLRAALAAALAVALAVSDMLPAAAAGGCYTASATCDSKILRENGWWIDHQFNAYFCIWKKYKNPLAYDRTASELDVDWAQKWYPKWKTEIDKVYEKYKARLKQIPGGVAAVWQYKVEIDPTGKVTSVTFDEEESAFESTNWKYNETRYRLDKADFQKALEAVVGPAFPPGSERKYVEMPVRFHNRADLKEDAPPPREDEASGKILSCE